MFRLLSTRLRVHNETEKPNYRWLVWRLCHGVAVLHDGTSDCRR